MQLTRHTDFALRVLMYLTAVEGDSVTIAQIAQDVDVPKNHLMKVVQSLAKKGYVQTRRGVGGGTALGIDPQTVTVGQVVRYTERNLDIMDCSRPVCPKMGGCTLKDVLSEAKEAFLSVLDRYTLMDLVQKNQGLKLLMSSTNENLAA